MDNVGKGSVTVSGLVVIQQMAYFMEFSFMQVKAWFLISGRSSSMNCLLFYRTFFFSFLSGSLLHRNIQGSIQPVSALADLSSLTSSVFSLYWLISFNIKSCYVSHLKNKTLPLASTSPTSHLSFFFFFSSATAKCLLKNVEKSCLQVLPSHYSSQALLCPCHQSSSYGDQSPESKVSQSLPNLSYQLIADHFLLLEMSLASTTSYFHGFVPNLCSLSVSLAGLFSSPSSEQWSEYPGFRLWFPCLSTLTPMVSSSCLWQ